MPDVMTRQEHLAWCKERAQEYCERGEYSDAIASMMSDLGKHPETESSIHLCSLAVGLMAIGDLRTRESVSRFINGFN